MKPKKGFANSSRRPNQKLNITSLMDVLTIILIFLLVNYSEEKEETNLPDFIKLPTVLSKENSEKQGHAIFIGVNKMMMGKDQFVEYQDFFNEKETIIPKITEFVENIQKTQENPEKPLIVAISADKEIPYNVINTVVVGLGNLGVTNINFLALKKKD